MSGTARILSIDGGGIRGLIPALVLERLEALAGRPIGSLFHLVAGTSTGGILATGLVRPPAPLAAADLVRFYRDEGPIIFRRSLWKGVASLGGTTDEKYDATGLEEVLRRRLGEPWLGQVEVADLLVTAYEIEKRDPFFFKSWKARGLALDAAAGERADDRDFRLWEAARATAAAPTYFEPASIRSRSQRMSHALVDGGVYANNPAMCAYASARRIYPHAADHLVVSLGTGLLERPIPYADAKDWGLLGWARPILHVIFDGQSDTADYQLRDIPNVRLERFQTDLGLGDDDPSDDMDDASAANIRRLEEVGRALVQREDARLRALAATLAAPLADRGALGYPAPVL